MTTFSGINYSLLLIATSIRLIIGFAIRTGLRWDYVLQSGIVFGFCNPEKQYWNQHCLSEDWHCDI